MTDHMITAHLSKTDDTSKQPKQVSPKDVVVGKNLSRKQNRGVRALVEEAYKKVFMMSPKLKKDAKPVHRRKPNWGPTQEA